ncbi:hypothetical protein [Bosea sp. (in: a-proteobacteria)]|jgi:hypothetical protein|uniref:hypothetical protein n=1 Tax=Bosea sp. (in: a-proteobacteria) TaxID=1871050 RepID=UPI0025BEA895|nr:hypothetical protein [Bosea sp. (in: a-proteobacteria)]
MTEAAVRADACLDVDLPIDLADHHAMNAAPTLPNGDYPFRDEVYPLAKLAISEAPPELAEFLIEQANANGIELIRDAVVELVCRGEGIPVQRFVVYWPSGSGIHVLVPKRFVVGKA